MSVTERMVEIRLAQLIRALADVGYVPMEECVKMVEDKRGVMVERVARAITMGRLLENRNLTDDVRAEQVEAFWKSYVSDARTAIAAMREPTEAMIDAGDKHERITQNWGASCDGPYQLMIDEALREDAKELVQK